MHCPFCLTADTKVIDSRLSLENNSTRRRRKCEQCEKRFTTHEKIEHQLPAILKNDGRREPYRREKLISGIKTSCAKRPLTTLDIEEIIEAVERFLRETEKKEITTRKIGAIVIEQLFKKDPVAYVRFASHYWNYQDISDFVKGLEGLIAKTTDQSIPKELHKGLESELQ